MSKLENFNKWLAVAQILAPAALLAAPHGQQIAAAIPSIVGGIVAAEQIPGATGEAKKAHVMDLAMAAFSSLQQTGKLHIGQSDYQAAVSAGIDTTVKAINLVHAQHQAVPAGVLLPPSEIPQ